MSEQGWLEAKGRLEARRAEATPRAGILREDVWAALDEIKRLQAALRWERERAVLLIGRIQGERIKLIDAERDAQRLRERADQAEAKPRVANRVAAAALAAQPAGK